MRSIRQVSLIRDWQRARSGGDELPNIATFTPSERAGDMLDVSIFRIAADGERLAYLCVHAGERVRTIYDEAMRERSLHDCLDAEMAAAAAPVWNACVATRLPVYSTITVSDPAGCPVTVEQVFLPYCGKFAEPEFMVASLHAWSTEGRFIAKGLLRVRGPVPAHQVILIDPAIAPGSGSAEPAAIRAGVD